MRTNSTKAANHVKPILRIMLILGIAVQTITLTACDEKGKKPGESVNCSGVYNAETHFCHKGKVYVLCGGNDDDGGGGSEYDIETKFCIYDVIFDKCGGEDYQPATHSCCDNNIYDIETHYCNNSRNITAKEKCGESKYNNPETEFCVELDNDYIVADKCGGKEWNLEKEHCFNETIYEKASDSLTTLLLSKHTVCPSFRELSGIGEADLEEIAGVELNSFRVVLVEADDPSYTAIDVDLVKENEVWKVYHVGDAMQCQ